MQFNYEIRKLTVNHNAIADWLIANPGKAQQRKCAEQFDITESWLSTLINQDAFQSLLKHKQESVFDQVVIPLQDKIAGVAHASVEKLGKVLDDTNDGRLVKDIGDSMLKALGYGGQKAGPSFVFNNQTNHLTVNQDALAEARQRQSQHYGRTLESPSNTAESTPQIETSELQDDRKLEVGEARELRSKHVNSGTPVQGQSTEGDNL